MAGLSLECGDCKALLRTTEEAQEHAELTGHKNFHESTQAVLNLICTSCGKPCRTQTEQDLHTKRTGHADFADKTAETAKPIVLENKPVAGPSVSGEGGSAENAPEMVVPEVNKEALAELEAMGFPTARSTRALHFTGSSNVETAVNWIVEHENDPDIDEMPLVPSDANTSIQSLLTPEEAKAKAQELVQRAKRKKEEEEKRMEKERERERIRIGKELQEARRIEEQQERQRIIAFRKAEKEEENRARLKIRQKLEEDKAERRRKLGLPPEEPKPVVAAPPPQEEKKPFVPLRPASKAEQMRECLRGLKQAHKEDEAKVKKAFQTMLTYIGNVARSPNEDKFRKIRLTNATFQERVGSLRGGIEFLQLCGFERDQDEFLTLPREKVDMVLLNTAGSELNSAINNPFFGVL
ncbi:uncharacterized protein [Physcomitrium patens]|uniref:UBA domain-containing protein n=1 Tax=Physcomitrium patens TaxID=3218 RepID=A9TXD9_PHYPA|nr:vicilin-like seed storage protein At2g18540 [Physcomitrium patens]PNR59992.1 hypothetical protein PHYPA_002784 [Physcomitrium patens]|eukprot:XP_024359137.1 vicilin-like seed storage protein At2g18540 [Physcomitrella patens]